MEQNKITITSQPKWKSKYFWIGIGSIVAFVLGNWGLYDYIGLTDETFQKLLDLVFTTLGFLGVWNDSGNAKEW
jgi:uncharacterized membrane protein